MNNKITLNWTKSCNKLIKFTFYEFTALGIRRIRNFDDIFIRELEKLKFFRYIRDYYDTCIGKFKEIAFQLVLDAAILYIKP